MEDSHLKELLELQDNAVHFTDGDGLRKVMLNEEDFNKLLVELREYFEDIQALNEARSRNEPGISLDELEAKLRAQGKL